MVHNPGPDTATFEIALLPWGRDNSAPERHQFMLDPEMSARYDDILLDLFDFQGAATLRVTPLAGRVLAHARTFSEGTTGTFGQFVSAVSGAEALTAGQRARVIGLIQSPDRTEGFRTNLGLVNACDLTIDVTVELYTGSGFHLGTRALVYDPSSPSSSTKFFSVTCRQHRPASPTGTLWPAQTLLTQGFSPTRQ